MIEVAIVAIINAINAVTSIFVGVSAWLSNSNSEIAVNINVIEVIEDVGMGVVMAVGSNVLYQRFEF